MRKRLLILTLAACFIACNAPTSNKQQADSTSAIAADINTQVIDQTPVTFAGMYTFGNEINTFRDCGNQKTYWVNDSLSGLRQAYEKTVRPLSYPYESIYAEVRGYLAGKSNLGYASEYENVLVVTEIVKLEAKNLRTECYDYEFIALGNEPFWSLDIVPTEQQIILKDLSENKVYQFPYHPANIGGGVHRFETLNGTKDKLVIIIREESCSDGMSDNTYRYSSEVIINDRTLTGCAIQKGDHPGERP